MLNEFLFTKIEEDIRNIWFQQDGATCYTAEATLDVGYCMASRGSYLNEIIFHY